MNAQELKTPPTPQSIQPTPPTPKAAGLDEPGPLCSCGRPSSTVLDQSRQISEDLSVTPENSEEKLSRSCTRMSSKRSCPSRLNVSCWTKLSGTDKIYWQTRTFGQLLLLKSLVLDISGMFISHDTDNFFKHRTTKSVRNANLVESWLDVNSLFRSKICLKATVKLKSYLLVTFSCEFSCGFVQ